MNTPETKALSPAPAGWEIPNARDIPGNTWANVPPLQLEVVWDGPRFRIVPKKSASPVAAKA